MIILKRAGRPGQLFSVKWTFLWSRSSKKVSNDKDNDEQDVSNMAFFPKSRSVNRLFKFRTFFGGRFLTFLKCVAQKRKQVLFFVFF